MRAKGFLLMWSVFTQRGGQYCLPAPKDPEAHSEVGHRPAPLPHGKENGIAGVLPPEHPGLQ